MSERHQAGPVARAVFGRPDPSEHDPYYSRYIDRTPAGDLITVMRNQVAELRTIFGELSEERAGYAYAPGKWTIREVLGHLIDTERVFSYRAASISRGDPSPLPGFDQDVWVPPARYNERSIGSVLGEWVAVRMATVAFLEGAPADAPSRRGVASDKEVTVRALVYLLPGHVQYHLEQLRERYQ